jgi:hypothetical protein
VVEARANLRQVGVASVPGGGHVSDRRVPGGGRARIGGTVSVVVQAKMVSTPDMPPSLVASVTARFQSRMATQE